MMREAKKRGYDANTTELSSSEYANSRSSKSSKLLKIRFLVSNQSLGYFSIHSAFLDRHYVVCTKLASSLIDVWIVFTVFFLYSWF